MIAIGAVLAPSGDAPAAPQGTPAPTDLIDELADVHPFSYPVAQAMTPDGRWVFSAEGGAITRLEFGGQNPSNTTFTPPENNAPFLAAPSTPKRVQLGSEAVIAAEMVLDPELDLSDDGPGSSPNDDDANDIIYVAGGHQGLWAIEAHPGTAHQNRAVRLDNSGDKNPATQHSLRFCTSVAIMEVDGEQFVIALFARRDKNLLRAYPLQAARDALGLARASAATPPDVGHEIAGATSCYFKAHPYQAPDVVLNGENVTWAGCYGMNLAVDQDPRPWVPDGGPIPGGIDDGAAEVYVAAMSGGLVRYRFYMTNPGGGAGGAILKKYRTWGPVFGTDVDTGPGGVSAYDDQDSLMNGMPVNSSGLPVHFFRNFASRVVTRSTRHGEVQRCDPPYFMDVAVQNNAEGHYLYAACGHLGWFRFDIGQDDFKFGIPIEHHEGAPSIQRNSGGAPLVQMETVARFLREVDIDAPSPVAPTVESSPIFEPFDFDTIASGAAGHLARNGSHANRLALTRIGTGSDVRTVLVVTYRPLPWTQSGRQKGPGRVLDQTFVHIGGFDPAFLKLWHQEESFRTVTVAYDRVSSGAALLPTYSIVPGSPASIHAGSPNATQAMFIGGDSLFVHPSQQDHDNGSPTNESLRILHSNKVLKILPPGAPGNPNPNEKVITTLSAVCMAFMDLSAPVASPPPTLAAFPHFVRSSDEIQGRYNFGTTFALLDDDVVIQANNDFPVQASGLAWTDNIESPSGSVRVEGGGAPGTGQDKRLDTGIQCDDESQFIRNGNEQWVIGDRTITNFVGTFFYFAKHSLTYASGVPTFAMDKQWVVEEPWDRNGDNPDPYYSTGTSNAQFDAWTSAVVSAMAGSVTGDPPGPVAETYLTMSRCGTPDGVALIGKDILVDELDLVPGGLTQQDVIEFDAGNDPWEIRLATPRSEWWAFTLNSHPEWDNTQFQFQANPPPGSSLGRTQQIAFVDPKPPLENGLGEEFENRVSYGIGPIIEVATTRTHQCRLELFSGTGTGEEDEWVLAAPSAFASCPPEIDNALGGPWARDPANAFPTTGFEFLPIPAGYRPDPIWAAQYRKGFVMLWQMSGPPAFPLFEPMSGPMLEVDPWSRARRAAHPTPPSATYGTDERPAGSSMLDPLFLVGDGTAAFRLYFVDLDSDGSGTVETRKYAFVVDFTGTIQVFDVTDILDVRDPAGYRSPVHVWVAPRDPLELRLPNLYDIAIDKAASGLGANIYVACSRVGVEIVNFDPDTGFSTETVRLVTSGEAHSCTIRERAGQKVLLVGDLSGGYRFYREGE